MEDYESTIDFKMIKFADKIANTLSKDKSTKVGAVITDDNGFIISNGYNGIPRKMNETNERIYKKPDEIYNLKYVYNEHAERNAIYNIGYLNHTFDNKIILTTHTPDIEESRAFISSGNKTLIVIEELMFPNKRTQEHILNMFLESNAKIISLESLKKEYKLVNILNNSINSDYKFSSNYDLFNITPKLERKSKMLLDLIDIFSIEYQCKDIDNIQYRTIKGASSIIDKNSLSDLAIAHSGFTSNLNKKFNIDINSIDFLFRQGSIKNVIFSSLYKYLYDKNLYSNLCPCIECSKAIASVGIKKIISPYYEENDRLTKDWSFKKSEEFINIFNIDLKLI